MTTPMSKEVILLILNKNLVPIIKHSKTIITRHIIMKQQLIYLNLRLIITIKSNISSLTPINTISNNE